MKTESYINRYIRLGVLLIIIGMLFAVETFFGVRFLYRLWPVFLSMTGIGFIGIFYKREKREGLYLALGVYLICFSLLALYCNYNSWGMLGRLWPLFITFLGFSLLFINYLKARRRLFLFLGLILISLSAVFLLTFSVNQGLWWIIFILLGLSILIAGRGDNE